ncbi:zf-HC2 domain-containing protein [Pseudobutyrivibrio xylanivorans]|uniref:Putative zinc-finger n=1 Tax=Pseudobutyrivibrio xylanivorans DSM 14809 TaxID=1123012 RepID=A0A1M6FXG8_PSEXY|nr:zf-HC2 domain-containing protein [Pseudobutyrivibrio xylanivorans]SHJ02320.1 Putative zinc-finger [Pseudobutyrivibrio xylanivorans DSM 14809]
MKYSCDVIKDLLPLFHDDVCSDDTKKVVNEHLNECEACRDYYKKMCSSDVVELAAFDEKQEKKMAEAMEASWKGLVKKAIKVILIILGAILAIPSTGLVIFLLVLFLVDGRVRTHTDIEDYEKYRSGPNAEEEYRTRWGMDEDIWPGKITDEMNVADYKLVYYNPWDAQYVGYLVVDYDSEAYEKELTRLESKEHDDYFGIYGVTGEKDYQILAMDADDYHGFIYAMTDGKGRIIYAEQVFCNYFMDLKYEKYIPEEYLLEGFDASATNPYHEKMKNKTFEPVGTSGVHGLSAYDKQKLIDENHSDLHSYFMVFPKDVKKVQEGSYTERLHTDIASTSGIVFLNATYSESDYEAEVERLSKISCTIKTQISKKEDEFTQEIMYDDSMYNYPAYIAADGNCGTYEYALLDEENHMITYVLVKYPDDEILRRYKDYLKKDRKSYDDSGTNTWEYFSIYAHQFPGEDGLSIYGGE